MGGNSSTDYLDVNLENNLICLICKKNTATFRYSECGHLGICDECHNVILSNTTCSIKCPFCQKHNKL